MIMKVILLVLTVSIMLPGVWANADTKHRPVINDLHQDSPPGMKGDCFARKRPTHGEQDPSLLDGIKSQVAPSPTDPAVYLTDLFGVTTSLVNVHGEEDVDAWTFMLAGKLARSGNVSPFITLGAGIMPASIDTQIGTMEPSVRRSRLLSKRDSDTKACGKLGAGVDYFPTQNVSIGLEGSYVFGLGDLEFDSGFLEGREMNMLYLMVTLGAAYHF